MMFLDLIMIKIHLKKKKFKSSKVLHHMQGTPNTMQKNPKYNNVLLDIYDFFEEKIKKKIYKKINI